jgi:serine/threonine protein kinase
MAKRLAVVDGADQGATFLLNDSGVTTIGSSRRHCDVCLHDLYVRRTHAEIDVQADRILVRALDSHDKVLINGHPMQQQEQELRFGDVVRVGNSHLRLEIDDAPVAEAAPEPEAKAKEPAGVPHLPWERLAELADHQLAHYQIGPVLGEGYAGTTFRARDLKGGHIVALKVLPTDFPADAAEMQRFVQAMRTVLPVRHPNLVTLYNAGRTPPYCWLAVEYVEGESLAQVLERVGGSDKINWRHALRLGVHVGRALEFIHNHRLRHGNITPRNILMRLSDKVVKLGDLMLSKALEGSAVQKLFLEPKLLAELPYLAPEQVEPNAFEDNLTDIYALGAAMYARLTGQPPFQGEEPEETISMIREAPLEKPRKLQSTIPHALEAVVVRLLARRQEERYQTAGELLADLEAIAEREEVAV